MRGYQWQASQQVVEKLLSVRGGKKRQILIDFFDHLVSTGNFETEDSFEDKEGNQFFVKPLNQWVITYKVDHAVKIVNIVVVEP